MKSVTSQLGECQSLRCWVPSPSSDESDPHASEESRGLFPLSLICTLNHRVTGVEVVPQECTEISNGNVIVHLLEIPTFKIEHNVNRSVS